jgi:hypothetical protein
MSFIIDKGKQIYTLDLADMKILCQFSDWPQQLSHPLTLNALYPQCRLSGHISKFYVLITHEHLFTLIFNFYRVSISKYPSISYGNSSNNIW